MAYIAMAGIIGAGKTFVADRLGKMLNIDIIHEPQLTPEPWAEGILGDFYNDMKRYGFMFQIYLAHARCAQIKKIHDNKIDSLVAISDRSIYEDLIFSRMLYDDGLMDKREHELHKKVINDMLTDVPRVVIKINSDPQRAYNNMLKRNRKEETLIPLDYLVKLNSYYDNYFTKFCPAKIITVDIPIIDNKADEDKMILNIIKKIQEYIN